MQNIKDDIEKIIEKYPDKWKQKTYKTGFILYRKGGIVDNVYYCESGIVKVFDNNENEESFKEDIKFFLSKNELIVPPIALMADVPIMANFQIIKNCEMQVIKKSDWKIIEKQEPVLKDILAKVSSNFLNYLFNFKRNLYEENHIRLKKFMEEYSYYNEIIDDHILSYLNFSEKTLIRARKKLSK